MKDDKDLSARNRMAKDVRDVKSKTGKKYNKGLKEAVQYGQQIYPK